VGFFELTRMVGINIGIRQPSANEFQRRCNNKNSKLENRTRGERHGNLINLSITLS
jgi:hypothetical protein